MIQLDRRGCVGTFSGTYSSPDERKFVWQAEIEGYDGHDKTLISWYNGTDFSDETLETMTKEVFAFLGIAKENVIITRR